MARRRRFWQPHISQGASSLFRSCGLIPMSCSSMYLTMSIFFCLLQDPNVSRHVLTVFLQHSPFCVMLLVYRQERTMQ